MKTNCTYTIKMLSHIHTEQLPLDGLETDQFLSLAVEATHKVEWIIASVNKAGFVAYTNNGIFSWNAEIKMRISDGWANLQSQCRGDAPKDVIENKKNIQKFITVFKTLKNHYYLKNENEFSRV